MSISVKIGPNLIMKEPLHIFTNQNLPYQNNNSFPPSKQLNTTFTYQSNPYNTQFNHLEVKPKFLKNAPQINQDTLLKIHTKIDVLNKISTQFFPDDTQDFTESSLLETIISQISLQKQNDDHDRVSDYPTFQDLISFLSNIDQQDYTNYSSMTQEQYLLMSSTTKAFLINQIRNNKSDLISNLSLNSSSSLDDSVLNRTSTSFSSNYGAVSGEYNKFRNYVNVATIPDEHVKYYLSKGMNDFDKAIELYFKNSYGTDLLTLKFVYENQKESSHFFKFSAKPVEFHAKVRCDCSELTCFKFYTIDDHEVSTISNKIKCIGAYHFPNNTVIKVKDIR